MSSEAEDAVVDYLKKQNRPYSAVDIFNNLHKEHGKTAVQKALDALVVVGRIREKLYGKQKVYVVNQLCFDDNKIAIDLNDLDSKIADLNEKFMKCSKSFRDSEALLTWLVSTLHTVDAKEKLVNVKKEMTNLDERLQSIEQNPLKEVDPEFRMKIVKDREKYFREWRKRRRIANEMIDSVLDGYPKGKKVFYEELGIETDENIDMKML